MNSEEMLKNDIKESINKIKSKLGISDETTFDENAIYYINDFKKFYLENIENLKKKYDWAIRREEYLNEYPLSKLNELKLSDYALGTDKYKESLSYKLEYGKYKNLGITIGGGSAAKFGIYKKRETKKYYGVNNQEIDKPDIYWSDFRNELFAFLSSLQNVEKMENAKDKYPKLKGMSMVLTKLASIYYPEKFLNICSKEKLIIISSYFKIPIKNSDSPEKISYDINKYIREMIPEVTKEHPYFLGEMLYRYINLLDENNFYENPDEDYLNKNAEDYKREDFLKDIYISEEDYERLNNLLNKKKNIILEGSPGVGKTFMAKRLAYSRIGSTDSQKVITIQFHQSYSYEDFIEGIRPTNNEFELVNGIFKDFCLKAQNDKENSYYVIIDEINRGNISKILGELMMLIEVDKRESETVILPYSREEFFVPNNLYIIGMLNTADRSLTLIDYALRRRFSFFKVKPAFNNEKFKNYITKFNNKNLEKLLEVIKKLNEFICEDESLGSGFEIGHSYFCNLNFEYKKELEDIVEFDILPMLKEYWFDDESKYNDWKEQLINSLKDE